MKLGNRGLIADDGLGRCVRGRALDGDRIIVALLLLFLLLLHFTLRLELSHALSLLLLPSEPLNVLELRFLQPMDGKPGNELGLE